MIDIVIGILIGVVICVVAYWGWGGFRRYRSRIRPKTYQVKLGGNVQIDTDDDKLARKKRQELRLLGHPAVIYKDGVFRG